MSIARLSPALSAPYGGAHGQGLCKLTGKRGRFVRCHIIPEALTRPERPGANLVQYGQGSRPIKRWTSWYDPKLVVDEGEAVLARYDNFAIAAPRQHKLVWGSWGPMLSLATSDFRRLGRSPLGLRSIVGCDTKQLRLFFLSILWRAATTDLAEFANVKLRANELEQLRLMVLQGKPEPVSFFWISLTQLSTRGIAHNLGILDQAKVVEEPEGPNEVPFFRIYFDGLIAHLHRPGKNDATAKELGPMVIGNEDRMTISTVTFEASSERRNLAFNLAEAYRDWPERMEALGDINHVIQLAKTDSKNA